VKRPLEKGLSVSESDDRDSLEILKAPLRRNTEVSKPDRHPLDWTGAPVVALGLWVLAIILSGLGRSATRAWR